MAIGRLGSFKTSTTVGLNTNTALYASTGTLSKVTIHVTNQGVEDATFSIGISSGTSYRDSDFIVFGQTIKKNTYASISNVGICSGETIFARANESDVSFIVHSVVDYDASIGTFFGRQQSVRTSLSGPAPVNNPVVLYTAPRAAQVSISVNNTSQDDATYSVGISSGGLSQFTSADYIIFGQSLPKRTTQVIDSIGIGTGQSIIVKANETDVTFVAYDLPTSVLEKITVTDAISIASSVTALGGFYGNLTGNVSSSGVSTFNSNVLLSSSARIGIGTTNPTQKLDVVGRINAYDGIIIDGKNVTSIFTSGSSAFRIYNSTSNEYALDVFVREANYLPYSRQLSPQVGTAITASAIGVGDTRGTDAAIYDYCWNNYSIFDADGDGVVSYNDSLVIIRYLFDITGGSFPDNAIISGIDFPSNATRTTSTSIRNYLGLHTMGGTGKLDVGGDGTLTALGDGLMIIRVFAGGSTNPSDNAPAQFLSTNYSVGIGTTASTSKLSVTQNSSSDAVKIIQTGTGNPLTVGSATTSAFVVNSSGNVGVGTTNATTNLDIVGNAKVSNNLTVSGITSVNSLYVGNSISGPGFDASAVAYSIVFGS